jgi:hypothetical protein
MIGGRADPGQKAPGPGMRCWVIRHISEARTLTQRLPNGKPRVDCCGELGPCRQGGPNPKPEARRPKEIRRPKAEVSHSPSPSFGFRISAFFRVSAFGLRISGLRDPLCLQPPELLSSPAYARVSCRCSPAFPALCQGFWVASVELRGGFWWSFGGALVEL